MAMWLTVSLKEIKSFSVHLIYNFNMTIVGWLTPALKEEMIREFIELSDEVTEEHPNSKILVSFILLGTILQMLWSVLIKLDDELVQFINNSNDNIQAEIVFYRVTI